MTEPVGFELEVVTAALRVGAIEDSFLWPLLKDQVKVKCEGKAGLPDFKPEMRLHSRRNFDLRWNRAKWLKRRIETADASIVVTLSLTVQGAASAGFGCELVPQRGVPIFFIAVPVGPVPVPVRVEATGALKAEATVATDKGDHLEVDLDALTGIEYDGEQVKARRRAWKKSKRALAKRAFARRSSAPRRRWAFGSSRDWRSRRAGASPRWARPRPWRK